MVAAHSLRLGTLLVGRASRFGTAQVQERYFNENLRHTADLLNSDLELAHVRTFVIAGVDAKIASLRLGKPVNDLCASIERKDFIALADSLRDYTVEECIRELKISAHEAEGLATALLIFKFLLEQTGAAQVVVPQVSIREGFLIDLAQGVDPALQEDFYYQITASALNLGRKFHFDEPHSLHVAKLCMTLFDALVKEHGMNRRERMMLETAAILHDVGMYVRAGGHHLHGQYLVAHSEIFGLHRGELDIIANVVRYHRGGGPQAADIDYLALQREERVLVLKMAAILRVADALDRGHSRQIPEITVEKRPETVVLHSQGSRDLSLEHIGLEEKGGLFQDVFGYKVVLV